MMNKLNKIIEEFEDYCGSLAISHDSPCDDTIREWFEKYHQEKLNKTYTIDSVRREIITSFIDKNGVPIKEGDIIREVLKQKKENYHYEERFDMMGNGKPTRIIDKRYEVKGWCIMQIEWSKDCLVAERLTSSGNISTSGFYYLNSCFMSINNPKDIEIIGSIYNGWNLDNYIKNK